MKFKITSLDCNKNIVTHFYDNITQCIQSDKKIPIYLDQDPRCKNMVYKPTYRKEGYIQSNLKELRIQLGLNCNFRCKYCNQRVGSEIEKKIREVKLPDEVRVKKFIELLKKNKINPKRIALWGGEPFVYWKLLKILVPELRKLYPDQPLHTITNGSLLDDEKVDFALKYKISLTLSHDAWAFEQYRNDANPLDSPVVINAFNRYIDSIKGLENMWYGINLVVSPYNANVLGIDNYFKEKFGRQINWHFESIVKLDKDSAKIIPEFTEDQKRTLLNGMFLLGTQKPDKAISDLRDRVSQILNCLINRHNAKNRYIACDVANSNVIATTLEGKLLACHGATAEKFQFGHINDIGHVKNDKIIPQIRKNGCSECPVVGFCRGGCSIAGAEDTSAACENLKLWYSGMLAPAWFILFNTVIQKIEPLNSEECEGLEDY